MTAENIMDTWQIDNASPMPIYAQLEHAIKLALISGRLHEGEQMPTVRQLAVDLKINANTVSRVYTELERQGILETRRGIGTFVTSRNISQASGEKLGKSALSKIVSEFLQDMSERGYSAGEIIETMLELTGKG